MTSTPFTVRAVASMLLYLAGISTLDVGQNLDGCDQPLAPTAAAILSFSVFSKRNPSTCQWEADVVMGEGADNPLLNGGWVVRVNRSAFDSRGNRQVIEVIASTSVSGTIGTSQIKKADMTSTTNVRTDEKEDDGTKASTTTTSTTNEARVDAVTMVEINHKTKIEATAVEITHEGEGKRDEDKKVKPSDMSGEKIDQALNVETSEKGEKRVDQSTTTVKTSENAEDRVDQGEKSDEDVGKVTSDKGKVTTARVVPGREEPIVNVKLDEGTGQPIDEKDKIDVSGLGGTQGTGDVDIIEVDGTHLQAIPKADDCQGTFIGGSENLEGQCEVETERSLGVLDIDVRFGNNEET